MTTWEQDDDQAALVENGLQTGRLKVYSGKRWVVVRDIKRMLAEGDVLDDDEADVLRQTLANAHELAKRPPS